MEAKTAEGDRRRSNKSKGDRFDKQGERRNPRWHHQECMAVGDQAGGTNEDGLKAHLVVRYGPRNLDRRSSTLASCIRGFDCTPRGFRQGHPLLSIGPQERCHPSFLHRIMPCSHAPRPTCSPIAVESRKRRGFVEGRLPITRGLLYPHIYVHSNPPIIGAPLPPCLAPYWPAFLPVTSHVWGHGYCTVQTRNTLKRRYCLRTAVSGAQTWSWRGRLICVQ